MIKIQTVMGLVMILRENMDLTQIILMKMEMGYLMGSMTGTMMVYLIEKSSLQVLILT